MRRWRYEAVEVFENRAISGASAIRPGYRRLLEAVKVDGDDTVLAIRGGPPQRALGLTA